MVVLSIHKLSLFYCQLLLCLVSGEVPLEPVVSKTSGHLFEKRLIEYNKHREGPIVKFNEDLYWDEKLQQDLPFNFGSSVKTGDSVNRNGAGEYLSSNISAFQTCSRNYWRKDISQFAQK